MITKNELGEILERVGRGETTIYDERVLRLVLTEHGVDVMPFEPVPPKAHDQAEIDAAEVEIERHQKLAKKS